MILKCTIGSNKDGDRYGLKLLNSDDVMLDIETLPRGMKFEISIKQVQ